MTTLLVKPVAKISGLLLILLALIQRENDGLLSRCKTWLGEMTSISLKVKS
jgi:hypothetical protein